jgi:hypothetical protein
MDDTIVEGHGKEEKYLQKLIEGRGVSDNVWDELTEKCTRCQLRFTPSVLKKYIKRRLGEVIVD